MADSNLQIRLQERPTAEITDSTFVAGEEPVQPPKDGEVLLRTLYLSLDPAMRGWIRDADSYVEPVGVGDVMRGGTVCEVVESKHGEFAAGDKVFCLGGWQQYVTAKPEGFMRKLPDVGLPLTDFLSVLGITGLTAYFGFLDVGEPKEGDTVVVSTAAGAVGSIVCQIAKLKGCRVVGLAGSDEKCSWVTNELGADVCINYKTANIAAELRAACPDKVDVYFDNVGGEILNTVLGMINVGARISICGAITQYNKSEPTPGPANYISLLTKRSRMQGFIVTDFLPRFDEAITQLAQWKMEGKLKHREDVVDGLENAPKAIHKLFDGSNKGKLIVKVADPS